MSLLNNYKNDDENKQVTTFEILSEQQEKVNEKEFIKLKIYKSEIDKAIGNLKELKKVNQYMNLTTRLLAL